jgi:hypothetical protein
MTDQPYAMSEATDLLGEYEPEEADAMLEALVESDGAEFAEARRGRSRGRTPQRQPGSGDLQRNGQGIKALNERINALDAKLNQTVTVVARDRVAVRRLEKLNKIDGAFDLVSAIDLEGKNLNAVQLLRGSIKSGFLGEPKGALGNPAVIAAAAFVLQNPGILPFGHKNP